jgi:hypothetical protein
MEIGLADAVAAVRRELTEAREAGANSGLVFEVGPIQMDFEVELRAEAEAKGRFRVWVVSADASAGVSRGRTHRVSFTLLPKYADGRGDVLVASEGPGLRSAGPPERHTAPVGADGPADADEYTDD